MHDNRAKMRNYVIKNEIWQNYIKINQTPGN